MHYRSGGETGLRLTKKSMRQREQQEVQNGAWKYYGLVRMIQISITVIAFSEFDIYFWLNNNGNLVSIQI